MSKRILSSPHEILRLSNTKTVEVDIPEWDCKVLVGALSGSNRERWENERRKDNPTNIRAMLVAFTVVNEKCETIFSEKDIAELNKKDWRALERISQAAVSFNVIGEANVEQEAKN